MIVSFDEAGTIGFGEDGLVKINVGEWPGRCAMRAWAYATIAMGNKELGDEILRIVGKQG